tara:strand:+ start:331 stop:801 length:471 start_codon:yes stop_codon:yes gene_type:complete
MHHFAIRALRPFIKTSFCSSIILLSISLFTHADVYKWTDEKGNIHYSDMKPNNANSEKLNIQTKPSASQQSSPQASAAELSQRKEQKLKEKSEQLKTSTKQREMDAKCETIKNNLKTMEANSRVKVNENGEIRFLTQEEIASKKEKYIQQIEAHCK